MQEELHNRKVSRSERRPGASSRPQQRIDLASVEMSWSVPFRRSHKTGLQTHIPFDQPGAVDPAKELSKGLDFPVYGEALVFFIRQKMLAVDHQVKPDVLLKTDWRLDLLVPLEKEFDVLDVAFHGNGLTILCS